MGPPCLWQPSEAQRQVVADAARAFELTADDLCSGRKNGLRPQARYLAVWALKARWPALSRAQLCAVFAWRDLTTAHHAIIRSGIEYERDIEFRKLADVLACGCRPPIVQRSSLPVRSLTAAPEIPPWRVRQVKPKNALEEDDVDARRRFAGTDRLLHALRREHPERCAA